MKHRLRSADLTQEDWLAWLHARHGFHEIPWITLIDPSADRRDADVMLSFVRFRGLSQSHEQWHIRLASMGIPLEELWGCA